MSTSEIDNGRPWTTFNFSVEIDVPGVSSSVCKASFSECDGLEMTLEVQTIKEGGNNSANIHLMGPVSYGRLSLKRGMTDSFDLWAWFDEVQRPGKMGLRGSGTVVYLAEDRETERLRFRLTGLLPVRIKAPTLSAQDGLVAIEELQLAYERMTVVRP